MKIGVVGGGLTGLSAAYYLSKKGHQITLFEKDKQLGGLASGLKIGDNFVDKYYRHVFVGDDSIIGLIKEVGLEDKLIFRKPKTAIFYRDQIYPFTSALDLLKFKPLPFLDRLRFGLVSLYLKMAPDGRKFSYVTAQGWLKRFYGQRSYKVVWEPLLRSKFGEDASSAKGGSGVSMIWLWSRIHDRSFSLGYLQGGFQLLVNMLCEKLEEGGVEILSLTCDRQTNMKKFDKLIVTAPLPVFLDFVEGLPEEYKVRLKTIKFRSVLSMVLVLKKSFMDGYWLNVNDAAFPFVAVVEHTNFIPSSEYEGKIILYVGSYLDAKDPKLGMSEKDLFELYLFYLKKINPEFSKGWVENKFVFKNDFAQPVVTTDYASKIPLFETPVKNVYLATMAQVYPQDRGMNQAVKLGYDVAETVEA